MTGVSFWFLAYPVNDWNCALSPWKAPAVFGNEGFGEGAAATLTEILSLCRDNTKRYYIGGYSLAGLFALWAAYQTDVFAGIAAAITICLVPRIHRVYEDSQYPQPEDISKSRRPGGEDQKSGDG